MYLYFLPLEWNTDQDQSALPTADGGLEATSAAFRPAGDWLSMAQAGEIMLYPPQFILLYLLQRSLVAAQRTHPNDYKHQRVRILRLLADGSPPWKEKFISPRMRTGRHPDGRTILDLDRPGQELEESGFEGEKSLVMLANFSTEGVRDLEVLRSEEVVTRSRNCSKM